MRRAPRPRLQSIQEDEIVKEKPVQPPFSPRSSVSTWSSGVRPPRPATAQPYRGQPGGIYRYGSRPLRSPTAVPQPRRPPSPENDLATSATGGPPGVHDGYRGRYRKNARGIVVLPQFSSDEEEEKPDNSPPKQHKVTGPSELTLPQLTIANLFSINLVVANTIIVEPTALSQSDMTLGAYLGIPSDTGVYDMLDDLRKNMFAVYLPGIKDKTIGQLPPAERKVAKLVAVQIPGTKLYHRAVIEAITTKYKCYLLDVGISVFLPSECIYPLLPDFAALPGLAVTLQLTDFASPVQYAAVKAVLGDSQRRRLTVEFIICRIQRGPRRFFNLYSRVILEGMILIDNVDLSVRVAQVGATKPVKGPVVTRSERDKKTLPPESPDEPDEVGLEEPQYYCGKIETWSY